MGQPTASIFRVKSLCFGVETSFNTAPFSSYSDAALQRLAAEGSKWDPSQDRLAVEAEIPGLGKNPGITGVKGGKLTFKYPLASPGQVTGAASGLSSALLSLLTACGLSRTNTNGTTLSGNGTNSGSTSTSLPLTDVSGICPGTLIGLVNSSGDLETRAVVSNPGYNPGTPAAGTIVVAPAFDFVPQNAAQLYGSVNFFPLGPQESVSFLLQGDQYAYLVTGCTGSVKISGKAKERWMLEFSFEAGDWTRVSVTGGSCTFSGVGTFAFSALPPLPGTATPGTAVSGAGPFAVTPGQHFDVETESGGSWGGSQVFTFHGTQGSVLASGTPTYAAGASGDTVTLSINGVSTGAIDLSGAAANEASFIAAINAGIAAAGLAAFAEDNGSGLIKIVSGMYGTASSVAVTAVAGATTAKTGLAVANTQTAGTFTINSTSIPNSGGTASINLGAITAAQLAASLTVLGITNATITSNAAGTVSLTSTGTGTGAGVEVMGTSTVSFGFNTGVQYTGAAGGAAGIIAAKSRYYYDCAGGNSTTLTSDTTFDQGWTPTAIMTTEGANAKSGWAFTDAKPSLQTKPLLSATFSADFDSATLKAQIAQFGHAAGKCAGIFLGGAAGGAIVASAQIEKFPNEGNEGGIVNHSLEVSATAIGVPPSASIQGEVMPGYCLSFL